MVTFNFLANSSIMDISKPSKESINSVKRLKNLIHVPRFNFTYDAVRDIIYRS